MKIINSILKNNKIIYFFIFFIILFSCKNNENQTIQKNEYILAGKVIKNKKNGFWKIYKENKIYGYGLVVNNKLEGKWTYFNNDGLIDREENYIEGKLYGKQCFYKEGEVYYINIFYNDSILKTYLFQRNAFQISKYTDVYSRDSLIDSRKQIIKIDTTIYYGNSPKHNPSYNFERNPLID